LMGEGVALRGLRPLWRLRCPRHIGSSCDALELRLPASAAAATGSAAFGRAGAFAGRPLALALACDSLEPGSPISRVCSLTDRPIKRVQSLSPCISGFRASTPLF
jgi:hypothetical protein